MEVSGRCRPRITKGITSDIRAVLVRGQSNFNP